MGGFKLLGNTLEEKLLLNSVVNENGCRIWQRGKDRAGYGIMLSKIKVHRLAFELWVEPLLDNMYVCHQCDVPSCLEPTHLFQDTSVGNTKDRNNKNRQAQGISINTSIFCEYDILEIRALRSNGFGLSELGRMYDVSSSTINNICKRRSWKNLDDVS